MGDTFTKRNLYPAFRQKGGGKRVPLCLLSLNCFHLKTILMPKWHILGWHILLPFSVKYKE